MSTSTMPGVQRTFPTFIEHTFSTVQTCRLQGRNVFDDMTQALRAWLAGTSPPSRVPEPIRAQHAAA